jgi:hypothetical protein
MRAMRLQCQSMPMRLPSSCEDHCQIIAPSRRAIPTWPSARLAATSATWQTSSATNARHRRPAKLAYEHFEIAF